MQYLHGKDEWQQTNVVNNFENTIASVDNNHATTTSTTTTTLRSSTIANNRMNQGTFEKAGVDDGHGHGGGKRSSTPTTDAESEQSGTFSMEASMSRIDALAESLSDLTRKRVTHHQQGRVKKRPSIGSTCSGANTSMCSGSSLAIDELASIDSAFLSSIDGFSAVSSVDNLGIGRLSLGGGGDDGASTTSARFTSGMWSVQDCEPWTCSICTFDNEPVFLSCEMCGQSKNASQRVQHLNNHRRISSHHQQMSEEQERERTRIQQEQRLREFQHEAQARLERPIIDSATPPSSSAVVAPAPLQIPTVIEAKRRKKTKAERDARRAREARERAEERRRNSGQIPSMETTLEESEISPSSSGSARSGRSGRRKSSRKKTTSHPTSAATVVTNATTTSASTISTMHTMNTMSTMGTNTPSAAPIATNTAPVRPSSPMEDASLQNVFEFSSAVNKPYRNKPDPLNESTATERTFDMDQSAMTNMGMSQSMMGMSQSHNMDNSSSLVLGQSSRQWYNSGSRRSGGAGAGSSSNKYNKAYRQQQQSSWFEGMDEISDEISV